MIADSQSTRNQVQDNESSTGQTWASAIIISTEEICWQNIQLELCRVLGYAGIKGNETMVQFDKDAAAPNNEEQLPSKEDWYTSLSHLQQRITDAR
jgi:hypothetical protein